MKVNIVCDPIVKDYYQNYINGRTHQHDGDNGIDLPLIEDTVFIPGTVSKVNLGIKLQPIDTSYGLDLRPRSSIGNFPLILTNSIGLIDNNYRGVVGAKLYYPYRGLKSSVLAFGLFIFSILSLISIDKNNHYFQVGAASILGLMSLYNIAFNEKPLILKKGVSILQLVSPTTEPIELIIVDTLDETTRGTGGFGSTSNKLLKMIN